MFDTHLTQIVFFTCIAVTAVTVWLIAYIIYEIFTRRRSFSLKLKTLPAFFVSSAVAALSVYCVYEIPQILYNGYNWSMIWEIGPDYLIRASYSMAVLVPAIYLFFLLSYYFPKKDDSPYVLILLMSIISGFGNSMMVFVVNESLNRTFSDSRHMASITTGLYIYFILGLLLFTTADYYSRRKLIILTNRLIYDKRMKIIDNIFCSPYYKFESMDNEKTFAALNNDPENVSSFVNIFVQILTGSVSLIVCFVYLWTLNGYGALFSILMVVLAAALFMLVSRSAQSIFEKNRDVQNVFFKYINDMVNGFKELYINHKKRAEFRSDIEGSCKAYRDTRIEGDTKFVGVTILGNTLYMVVIGVVAFMFAMLFTYIQSNTLRSFVVVYLYMGGIITMLTGQIPNLVRITVCWKRINTFVAEISSTDEKQPEIPEVETGGVTIKLDKVKFSYRNNGGEVFELGPIDYEFNSGEIVFITGGNGSGKTTLAKLITGLYKPDSGEITVNGEKVDAKVLGSYFSTVYSDFYLFDRVYGVNTDSKKDEIKKYLDILRINGKVNIKDGKFSTIRLSTGQRKRLALLIAYLEDKPVFFFDEWAADQDPEFRKFFYMSLIPELKAKGKSVIAITHDDRYFTQADKLIKMDMGHIQSRYAEYKEAGESLTQSV